MVCLVIPILPLLLFIQSLSSFSCLIIVLYVETVMFVLKFAWDVVGLLWAFDPPSTVITPTLFWFDTLGANLESLHECHNGSLCVLQDCYLSSTVCGSSHRQIRTIRNTMSSDSHGLLALSSEELRKHRHRPWKWRLEWLCCCLRLGERKRSVHAEIGTVMADTFTYFRGYVPSGYGAEH